MTPILWLIINFLAVAALTALTCILQTLRNLTPKSVYMTQASYQMWLSLWFFVLACLVTLALILMPIGDHVISWVFMFLLNAILLVPLFIVSLRQGLGLTPPVCDPNRNITDMIVLWVLCLCGWAGVVESAILLR